MDELSAFDRLHLERQRTLFMFYGFRWADGRQGGGYFKHAHSLSAALADLSANEGVADEGGYFVKDAFVEDGELDPETREVGPATLHVELISLNEIQRMAVDDESHD